MRKSGNQDRVEAACWYRLVDLSSRPNTVDGMNLRRYAAGILALAVLLTGCGGGTETESKLTGFPATFATAGGQLSPEPPLDLTLFIDEDYNPNQLSECPGALDPYACAVTVITLAAKTDGVPAAVALMDANGLWNNTSCFPTVQAVAEILATRAPVGERSALIQTGQAGCVGAFNEGIFEQSFIELSSVNTASAAKGCDEMRGENKEMCLYHLGVYLGNATLSDPQKASSLCEDLRVRTKSKEWPRPCDEGVWRAFFENEDVIARIGSLKPTTSEVLEFCATSSKAANLVCVNEAVKSFWKLPALGDNNARFGACDKLTGELRAYCQAGAGRAVATASAADAKLITDVCMSLESMENRDTCFQNGLGLLKPEKIKEKAGSLCESTTNTYECVRGVGSALRAGYPIDAGLDALDGLCATNLPLDVDACEDGLASNRAMRFNRNEKPTSIESVYAYCRANGLDPNLDNCMRTAMTGLQAIEDLGGVSAFATFCETVSPRVRSACLDGVGRVAANSTMKTAELVKLCASGDGAINDPYRGCVTGLLGALSSGATSTTTASALCAALPAQYAELCAKP